MRASSYAQFGIEGISMRVILFIFLQIFSLIANAASTNTQLIKRVQYNAASGQLFFVGEGDWLIPGCENAIYALFKPELEGVQEALSIGLAAYLAGKKVTFWGDCNPSGPEYFFASYIIIRD